MAKAPSKPKTARKPATRTAKAEPSPDMQSGMDPSPSAAERKAEVAARFAEADRKGRPETADEKAAREAEEIRVGQQVRGY